MHDLGVTLVAVATPPGRGGVGCVRISGPDAREVAATPNRFISGMAQWCPARTATPSRSTMVPTSCVSRRLMQRIMVDLPEPDGPQTTTFSPNSTLMLTSRSAWKSAKNLLTPETWMIGAVLF